MAKKRGDGTRPPRKEGRADPFKDAKPMTAEERDKHAGWLKLRRPADEALADLNKFLAQFG